MSTDPASVDTSFSLVKYNEPVLLPPDGTNGWGFGTPHIYHNFAPTLFEVLRIYFNKVLKFATKMAGHETEWSILICQWLMVLPMMTRSTSESETRSSTSKTTKSSFSKSVEEVQPPLFYLYIKQPSWKEVDFLKYGYTSMDGYISNTKAFWKYHGNTQYNDNAHYIF